MDKLFALQQQLSPFAAIEGECNALIAKIAEYAAPLCDKVTALANGTLICSVSGEGEEIMLWADVTTPGFYISGMDDKGFAYAAAAGLDLAENAHTRLRTLGGQKAVLRPNKTFRQSLGDTKEFYFDFGGEHKNIPSVGTGLVLDGQTARLNDNRVITPFGNGITPCTVLIKTMEQAKAWHKNIAFVFAVGSTGSRAAAYAIKPKYAINISATKAEDNFNTAEQYHGIKLGQGPVVRLWDGYGPCMSKKLIDKAKSAAQTAGIPLQIEAERRRDAGYRDVQYQNSGIETLGLALAMRGSGGCGMIYDLEDASRLATLLVEMCGEKEGQ